MRLTAFYDFAVAPASYDFMTFLCTTGIAAKMAKCDSVHIVFVPADTPDGWRQDNKPISAKSKAFRRDHVLIPLCRTINATHTVCETRDEAGKYLGGPTWPMGYSLDDPCSAYWLAGLIKMAKFGLPEFRVDPEAKRLVSQWVTGPYVTVTHRNTTYGDARNSSKSAWDRFGDRCPLNVITIPDTEDAGSSFGVGALAAVDPMIRFALYDRAEMNLGVNNGPMALCFYTGRPYLMFKMVADFYSTTPEFLQRAGLPVGSQLPWRNDRQLIVWKDDEFDVIWEEYTRMDESLHRIRRERA